MSHKVNEDDKIISDLKYILSTRHTIPAGSDENAPYVSHLLRYIKSHGEAYSKEVNRFEVINHLSDRSGREVVVWKGELFKVETSLQDSGRTLKVFLTDIAQLTNTDKDKT